jgi:4-amino-4-deoxy-L-arabinose transferase-like glycosyltransferase
MALWVAVAAIKLVIAARLSLFVDEAFYWQESRHPAMAYSDLPGLTAWLIGLGTTLGGPHLLALRAPFLLTGMALPWLVVAMGRRWCGGTHGWNAGSLTLLMPLAGTAGILALPDVPMVFASALCLLAGTLLLERVRWNAVLLLALGLAIGGLSHYRFAWVIVVGGVALACVPEGRRLFRDARLWLGLAVGAAAWLPLLLWNIEHGEAGLRFQLMDRHPWSFHLDGLWFPLIQAALTTPLLFVALMTAGVVRWRDRRAPPQQRYLALSGLLSTLGIFALGFFTDIDRVSFHWPLSGYLALLVLVPVALDQCKPVWRGVVWCVAALGMIGASGYYLLQAMPSVRLEILPDKLYLRNFAGWNTLAEATKKRLDAMPPGSRVLADDFKIGAELGFAMNDADIAVLDHPLNHKHGRAPQLRLWGLQHAGASAHPQLLVLSVADIPYRDLLRRYHDVCAMVGPLGPPRTVSIDHGAQRFLLIEVPAGERAGKGDCVTPAMAWIDEPVGGADVSRRFRVSGWAFKDGAGLERVQILLDGEAIAEAEYGSDNAAGEYWNISTDPHHPRIGFRADVRLPDDVSGRHWLGLRLYGTDGSVEDWSEQSFDVSD